LQEHIEQLLDVAKTVRDALGQLAADLRTMGLPR